MLEMFYPEGDYEWNAAGLVHVNNRIKEMLEDFIDYYVDSYDDSYIEHINSREERNRPLWEVIDLNRLRNDADFSEYLREVDFAPEYGWERSAAAFVSLYMLVCVKGVYKADLMMEHILLRLLESELDDTDEEGIRVEFESRLKTMEDFRRIDGFDIWREAEFMGSGAHMKVVKIPEPARTFMKYIINEKGILDEINDGLGDDDEPLTVEDLLNRYEDIDEYIEWCFEDHDCLLLDKMSSAELEKSGLAACMGIHINGDATVNTMKLPGMNSEIEFRMAPWETEFMDTHRRTENKQ